MAKNVIVGGEDCSLVSLVVAMSRTTSFHLLHEKWSSIARELEIPLYVSKKLAADYRLNSLNLADVLEALIENWVGRKGRAATLDVFLNTLKSNGLEDCAEPLRDKYFLKEHDDPDLPKFNITSTSTITQQPALKCLNNTNHNLLRDEKSKSSQVVVLKSDFEFSNTPDARFIPSPSKISRIQPDNDITGNTPLHIATLNNDCTLVLELVQKSNADVNATNSQRETPLHLVASHMENNGFQLLKTLIDNGANTETRNLDDQTFLHCLCKSPYMNPTLFHDICVYLVSKGDASLFHLPRCQSGGSPLHLALKNLDVEEQTFNLLHNHKIDFNGVDKNGDSILAYAVTGLRSKKTLSLLTAFGAHWKYSNKKKSILHVAAQVGNMAALKSYRKQRLDVNLVDEHGRSPLHQIVMSGPDTTMEFLKSLVKYGTNVNLADNEGNTSLHYLACMPNKARALPILKFLVDNGANVHAKNNNNNTFLHKLFGDSLPTPTQFHQVVEFLIQKGHIEAFNIPSGESGDYPLQHAVYRMNVEIATLELLHLSSVNFNPVNKTGNSLLACAVMGGRDIQFLSTLIRLGANPKHLNKAKQNLLRVAVPYGSLSVLKFFLNLGVSVNEPDFNGRTPLHHVLLYSKHLQPIPIINLFCAKGANLDAQCNRKYTALHYAIKCVGIWQDVVKCLIDNGADTYIKNQQNLTFFHYFLVRGLVNSAQEFHEFVVYLIRTGHVKLLETPGYEFDKTPIHWAVGNLELEESTLELLYSNGVNFNRTEKRGNSVLSYAITGGKCTEVLISGLIKRGANWNHLNMHGQSFLHLAASSCNLVALKYFIGLGLEVNKVDSYGYTPLHQVVQFGKKGALDFAKCLIENNVDINILNNSNQSAFDMALSREDGDQFVGLFTS